jgi:hypothetical protein
MSRRSCVVALVILGLTFLPLASPPAAAAGPTLSILTPRNDEVVGNGSPVVLTFAVSNFVLVQPGRVGQGSPTTEGHVDLSVDGVYSRLLTRVEPISIPLPSGPHTIRLQLTANNGTTLSPDVSASVRVVSTQGPAAGQPSIRFVWPNPGQVTGHDVYFAVNVTNFALVDPRGQPNAPNEGHIELFLNGAFQQVPRAYEPGFMVDMPDGDNTVTARLVNNDGSPLLPDVAATVTIRVKGAADPTPSALVTGGISGILAAILVVLLVRRRKASARFANERTSGR